MCRMHDSICSILQMVEGKILEISNNGEIGFTGIKLGKPGKGITNTKR